MRYATGKLKREKGADRLLFFMYVENNFSLHKIIVAPLIKCRHNTFISSGELNELGIKKMYAIIKKDKSAYFAGFSKSGKTLWTTDKNKAWTETKNAAACQARLISDEKVQFKPVFIEKVEVKKEIITIETPVITKEKNDTVESAKTETQKAVESKIKVMQKIELEVQKGNYGWIKNRNMRAKLTEKHNETIRKEIDKINKQLAGMRSKKEQDKRSLYHAKTLLELQVI
jgi:hypothetical protein